MFTQDSFIFRVLDFDFIHRIRATLCATSFRVECLGSWRDKWLVSGDARAGLQCILFPYLFNFMAELLMRMTLDGYQGGFRIDGRYITNLRYVMASYS